jgi:hypothetical protein
MYYQYVDSWHILKYLHLYLRCILDIIYIYILDLPASRKTCSTCFSMGDFRQDRRFCCFQATLQQSVCYSQKIYIGMHTLSYNTLSYNTHTLVQYSFVSVLYFWFFLIHLWFMYQFIGINASSVSIISPCLTPADSPQRRRKRERCSETGSCRWLTGDWPVMPLELR